MTSDQTRIVWLDARADTDDQAIGPKARSLIQLDRMGLPVPAGFCLLVEAYWEHIGIHGIIHQIGSAQDVLGSASLDQKKSTLSAIREAIVRAPVVEATRQAIGTYYRRLAGTFVAVRSSATAEDLPGQSFAGQYDTYLGITDLDECLTAIRQCWASLWTERAWEYRQQNGLDHLAVGMAVIVQSLVQADASGVLFTADPATGRSDRVAIEACWGLGEALASGRVTPDRFLIRKRDLHPLAKTLGDKQIESVLDQHGGIRQQPVAPERRSQTAIERPTAIRLARLAKRAEGKLGSPQDMEWAVQGGKVFFLQARPITTLPGAPSWEDRQIWTNANLGEVLPDVMTPMTASFTSIADDTLYRPVLAIFGLENVYRGKYERLIAGRLYFNASIGRAIIQHLPGAQRFDYQALLGGGQAAVPDDVETAPDVRISTARILLRLPRSIRSALAHRQAKARQSIQELQQVNCHLQDLDFSRMSQEELGYQFTTFMQDGLRRLDLLYAALAAAPLPFFYKLCERWLDDTDDSLANRLLADTGEMASARAGIDLWRLAVQAQAVPHVRQVLLSEEAWDTAHEKLSATDAGGEFLQGWNRFMACHGHHCRGELELYNPRWSERPDYVLKLLRGYLARPNATNPFRDRQQRERRREQLRQRGLRQLRNPVRRIVFERLLRAARSGSALRENFKNEAIRWVAALRRLLLAIGVRLTDTGVLAEPDDVFFLELPEVQAVLHGVSDLPISTTIAARRAEYQKNKSITPPKVVVGRFDPDHYTPEAETRGESTGLLHGVAASAGMALGKARVILRADTHEQVRTGEILVAPFTDPGWTPYFVPAAGIVTEQGGLLSHGSIIAREYGIPAVVNVPGATQIIRTGQMIRVDGNHGVCYNTPLKIMDRGAVARLGKWRGCCSTVPRKGRIMAWNVMAWTLLTCGLVSAAPEPEITYAERLGWPRGTKVVIFHVDDAGMSYDSDQGAIKALEGGVATSTSVMMPCPWVPHMAAYLKEHPQTDAGVHLTLTSEWNHYRWGPLVGKSVAPGLVDPQGCLWQRVEDVLNHATVEEFEKEIRAQIDRAQAVGITPTHLDSHMGTCFYEPFMESYVQVGIEKKIPILITGGHLQHVGAEIGQLKLLLRALAERVWQAGLPVLDDLVTQPTNAPDYEQRKEQLFKLLTEMKPGVTQIIVHCTAPTEVFAQISGSGPARAAELRLMLDPDVRAFLKKEGIVLTTWRELKQRREAAGRSQDSANGGAPARGPGSQGCEARL